MDCHALLQWIFLTQGLNPPLKCLLHWQIGSSPLAPPAVIVKSILLSTSYKVFQNLATDLSSLPVSAPCSASGTLSSSYTGFLMLFQRAITPSLPMPPNSLLTTTLSWFFTKIVLWSSHMIHLVFISRSLLLPQFWLSSLLLSPIKSCF